MKKNELIHLHGLLVQVAENYVEHGDATRDDFAAYDELGVTPMTLRASRATHERAVRTLLSILAARSRGTPLPPAPDDGRPTTTEDVPTAAHQ
jgi:hypothetical protein